MVTDILFLNRAGSLLAIRRMKLHDDANYQVVKCKNVQVRVDDITQKYSSSYRIV